MKVGRRTMVLGGVGIVSVAAAAVVMALMTGARPGAVSSAPKPTPTPMASTPVPMTLPHTATVSGSIPDWTLAPSTQVGAVAPEVGDAADGAVALSVDAPVVDKPVVVASVSAPVKAGAVYDVSAKVRLLAYQPTTVAAALHFGSHPVALPALDVKWTEVKARITPDTSSIIVDLQVDGPVYGLDLDDVKVVDADGVNAVPNPSFEGVTAVSRIANDSLVLSSGTAAMAVSLPQGQAQWSLTRGENPVASGSLSSTGGLQAIPLQGLDAGYFSFSVTDVNGATTSSPIAVIDRASPQAVQDARFGVATHLEEKTNDSAARYARSLGIATIRNDVGWVRNELKRGVYTFDPVYAAGFSKFHANGISALGIIDYGNKLYGNPKGFDNPEAIAAYGRYAAAVVEYFHLPAIEIYNEFNLPRFNTGRCGTDPKCYIPLLTAAHAEVRAVDPNVTIVSGATANYDAAWLNGLWQEGGLAYSDAISFHPYQVTKDPDALAGIVADARAGMQEYGTTTKPMWITELGTPETPEWGTADEQATYVLKATVTALGSGVEKLYWYDLINDTPDPHALESNFGLFSSPIEGVAALPPKPAAFVEALLIDQLHGRAATPAPPLKEGVVSYKFGTGPDSVTVAWAPNGDTTVDYKTTTPVDVVTTDGRVATVKPNHGVAVLGVPKVGVFIRASDSSAH